MNESLTVQQVERNLRRKMLALALLKSGVGILWGVTLSLFAPVMLPYHFAKECFMSHAWPWDLHQ